MTQSRREKKDARGQLMIGLLLIGFYLMKSKKKMDKKGSGFKVVNLGDSDNKSDKDDYEDRFSDAEKKLEEAQEALSKLK